MTNLTVEEQALISNMNKRLKTLELLLDEALEKETPESLKQWLADKRNPPIDTTEGEVDYVRCVKTNNIATKGTIIPNSFEYDKYPEHWEAATHAEFLAQEQGKEGDWAWNSYTKEFLGIITRLDLSDTSEITLDNQDGKSNHFATLAMLVKPSPEEIQTHLVEIAQKKYPVGTKFKNAVSNKEIGITDGDYEYSKENNALYTKDKPNKVSQCIWCNGKWAEQAPIETEQRWKPEKGQLYYYVNWSQKDKIGSFTWVSDETDIDFYELGNCFKTKEAAQKAAEAIKQYLSTNKF
jgi:hypothetical protein